MSVNTGRRGRPRKVAIDPDSPEFAPLFARLDAARAAELAALDAHAERPTQAALVGLLDARIRVCALRGRIAEEAGDGAGYKHETELMTKLTNTRDDAVGRLWTDDLHRLHALVTERAAVDAAIDAELADAGGEA